MRGTIYAETESWVRYSLVVLDAAAYRRPHGPVELPDNWTPARAETVVEVLNLLPDAVCSKYADALLQAGREDLFFEAQWPGSGGGDDLRRPRSLDRAPGRAGVGTLQPTPFRGAYRETPVGWGWAEFGDPTEWAGL